LVLAPSAGYWRLRYLLCSLKEQGVLSEVYESDFRNHQYVLLQLSLKRGDVLRLPGKLLFSLQLHPLPFELLRFLKEDQSFHLRKVECDLLIVASELATRFYLWR
jgi:hypothetical protein